MILNNDEWNFCIIDYIHHLLIAPFQILARYRFRRPDIEELVRLLQPGLYRRTRRSNALTPLEMVLVALRFYASGAFQMVVGDTVAISQPSVSRAITLVTNELVRLAPHNINMPQTDAQIRRVNSHKCRSYYSRKTFLKLINYLLNMYSIQIYK